MTQMIANMIQAAEPIVEASKTKDEATKLFKKTLHQRYSRKLSDNEVTYVIDLLWNERETIFKLLGNPAKNEALLAMV